MMVREGRDDGDSHSVIVVALQSSSQSSLLLSLLLNAIESKMAFKTSQVFQLFIVFSYFEVTLL